MARTLCQKYERTLSGFAALKLLIAMMYHLTVEGVAITATPPAAEAADDATVTD